MKLTINFSFRDLIGSIKLDSKTLQKIQEKSSTLPKLHHHRRSRTSLQPQQAASPDKEGVAMDLPPHVVLSGGSVTKEDREWVCILQKNLLSFFYFNEILLINLFCLQS